MAGSITILGLGPGDPELISRKAWQIISNAKEVYFRTNYQGLNKHIPASVHVCSFDEIYDRSEAFTDVYAGIVREILKLAERPEGVIYAVPGDPYVGEATVPAILEGAALRQINVQVVPGISFVEPCLEVVGYDALAGLYIADALDLTTAFSPPFSPDLPALIGQVHSRFVAADLKLCLLNQYPAEQEVILIHGAGTAQPAHEKIPLLELDHSENISYMTSLYIPALETASGFESFQNTIAHLRSPEGCPWDQKQTHQSLRPHLLEEAYETLEALDNDDPRGLVEELGDLLLQIVLHAQIASEVGDFQMTDIIAGINTKIIHRHPHVFGELAGLEMDEVLVNWERLKAEEKNHHNGVLSGIPQALPALSQAAKIQTRVALAGFDWQEIHGVEEKILEELQEIHSAKNNQERQSELGDLLFSVVNYARWLEIDPEDALRNANKRFRMRFQQLEEAINQSGRTLSELSLEEMDEIWEEVKRRNA